MRAVCHAFQACCLQPMDVIKTRLQLDRIGKTPFTHVPDFSSQQHTLALCFVCTSSKQNVSCHMLCRQIHRHLAVWAHHCSRRGCALIVERAHALCRTSHTQVRPSHGLKFGVPKPFERRGAKPALILILCLSLCVICLSRGNISVPVTATSNF